MNIEYPELILKRCRPDARGNLVCQNAVWTDEPPEFYLLQQRERWSWNWQCAACGLRQEWNIRFKDETNWRRLAEFLDHHPRTKYHRMYRMARDFYATDHVFLMPREVGAIVGRCKDIDPRHGGLYVSRLTDRKISYDGARWALRDDIESCLLRFRANELPGVRRELVLAAIYRGGWPLFEQLGDGSISRLWPSGRR